MDIAHGKRRHKKNVYKSKVASNQPAIATQKANLAKVQNQMALTEFEEALEALHVSKREKKQE